MKTTDFNSRITAHQLNEAMFKKFGARINFDSYTREQLENYRNLLRTKINQVEIASNFNDLLTNETYQKDKHVMDVLNTKIKEMLLGESKLAERKLTGAENKKKEEIVKAIKRDNPDKRTGKGKSSAYAIATAQAKKTAEGTTMNTNEAKKAKKDYDGDGKVESPKDEVWGSRAKAAAKSGKPFKESSFPTVADAKARAEKEKTTGKFDKKKNPDSGGTIYTRKSSTFTNGTEDKPKEKNVKEAAKPDFLDLDNDGNKKEPMKSAAKRKKKVKESTIIFRRHVAIVNEGLAQLLREDEEGKAKAITAASDMVNDFTTWMQRVGQYQTKSMIELADAIRAEFGQAESEAFKNAVAPALTSTIETLTAQREALSHAVAVLAGEAADIAPMGAETPDMTGGADEFGGEPVPADADTMNSDEFGASDAAAGGAETSGRATRESKQIARARKLQESHNLMRILSK
jgi:hypothetical protein